MDLTSFRVENFRCIDSIEITPRDFTSLIGPNNSGKSSVLRALDLFLDQKNPDREDWRKGHEEEPIIFVGRFEELEDWEREAQGVSGLVQDGEIKLRAKYTLENNSSDYSVESVFECWKQKVTIDGWSDDNNWGGLSDQIKEEIAPEVGIENGHDFQRGYNKIRLRDHIRDHYPDLTTEEGYEWTSEGVSIPTAFQQALPAAQLIPAVKDATEERKAKAGTLFNDLLKTIIVPAIEQSEEFEKLAQVAEELDDKLRRDTGEDLEEVEELRSSLTERLSSLIDAEVDFGLEEPDANKYVGKNTQIALDDGGTSDIERQGHGLQRALIFAILEELADRQAEVSDNNEGEPEDEVDDDTKTRSTILLFEEPELYIHPHLMRRLKSALRSIGESSNWQVLVSTHSPFLIDVGRDPQSLVIHRRDDSEAPPEVRQIEGDLFEGMDGDTDRERLRAVLRFHPSTAEAFFAEHVVLVEGDTEVAVLTRRRELLPLADLDPGQDRDITVVGCGGKWTIYPIAKVLKEFRIPFRIIHDRDKKGRTEAELEDIQGNDPFNANDRLASIVEEAEDVDDLQGVDRYMVEDQFEHTMWDEEDAPQSMKPFRAWRKAGEFIDEGDLPDDGRLEELLEFAFSSFDTGSD